jgi:hypothetical protein
MSVRRVSASLDERRMTPRLPLLVSLLAAVFLGCGVGRPPAATPVGVTFPPAAPTVKPVDGDAAIEGLKAALGPDSPQRLKATAEVRVDRGSLKVVMDGDFQGNEMDATMKIQSGTRQLSFDIIAAGGKAFVKPYGGMWARSPEKVPVTGSGPFGDMRKAELTFAGPSKAGKGLYTIVWKDPTDAARALNGTIVTGIKVKSSVMNFEVTSAGVPYTATYQLKGTAKFDGKSTAITVNGYYQFFRIHEPLVFESPMR